ncbi:hypothetical protein Tco_1472064 [Tanacetum coccineum]
MAGTYKPNDRYVGSWALVVIVTPRQGANARRDREDRHNTLIYNTREDYYNRALLDYEAETGVPFKLRHWWEVFKGSQKWMESEVPKFLAKSGEGSDKRYKTSGSSSFNIESGEI